METFEMWVPHNYFPESSKNSFLNGAPVQVEILGFEAKVYVTLPGGYLHMSRILTDLVNDGDLFYDELLKFREEELC